MAVCKLNISQGLIIIICTDLWVLVGKIKFVSVRCWNYMVLVISDKGKG